MNQIAKFTSADQTLTIAAKSGKSGINVRATVKTGKGKGSPKAVTGARATCKTENEAKQAFEKLVSEARSRGWTRVEKVERNAFTSIPDPAKGSKSQKGA